MYYTPIVYKTNKGFIKHKHYSPNKNYILVQQSSTKMLLRFEDYSLSISKLITDNDYGMLFNSEEPLNDILVRYSTNMDIEDFITIIARPLKQMEITIRESLQMGNTTKGHDRTMEDLQENWDNNTFGSTTDFMTLDTKGLNL